eukprot:TRINITY_DN34332_c0_g1_i1.p1 TRINITY_DN34332_c0_g1~~TRINITY_DN34332_c0_g1_i1.p1  ORF type:complete len:293 (+),score=46.09 TRINITY_DN34332_c0_g1_i1:47-880(+)
MTASTQQAAQQELERYRECYKQLGIDYRPRPVNHLRFDKLDIQWTGPGTLKRVAREGKNGKHVEPLTKIIAAVAGNPVQHHMPSSMMPMRSLSESHVAPQALEASDGTKKKRRSKSSRSSAASSVSLFSKSSIAEPRAAWKMDARVVQQFAATGKMPARGALKGDPASPAPAVGQGPQAPFSVPFERPGSCSSNSPARKKHERLASALEAEQLKYISGNEIGRHKPAPHIREGDEIGPYHNPFLTRFYDRRPGGGFFQGSGVAAPKLTEMPAASLAR